MQGGASRMLHARQQQMLQQHRGGAPCRSVLRHQQHHLASACSRRRQRGATGRSRERHTCSSSSRDAAATASSSTSEASTSGRFDPQVATFDDDLPHEQTFYDWKWGSRVSYVRAGRSGPPLLLCHGFGVGSYHFERNIAVLAQNHQVYAVDLLGQGQSWPTRPDCETSGPLRYSADTWTEQLYHFIQEKVGQPVYIAGNSLGGYLGVHLAAKHPSAVAGLILLNATPFWSQRPPLGKENLLWMLLKKDLDAAVPVTTGFKGLLEQLWWNRIRQPETIRSLLQLVYARPSAIDDALLRRILEATERPDALDAFTSILLSPRTELTFDEMLEALQCPVCLAYGRDDPWVVPIWGQRLKRTLPEATYLELAPAGHCPHHEAPTAINAIITTWVARVEAAAAGGSDSSGAQQGHHQHQPELLQLGSVVRYEEADGQVVEVSCIEGAPRNVFERWDATKWRLRQALNAALGRGQKQQQA